MRETEREIQHPLQNIGTVIHPSLTQSWLSISCGCNPAVLLNLLKGIRQHLTTKNCLQNFNSSTVEKFWTGGSIGRNSLFFPSYERRKVTKLSGGRHTLTSHPSKAKVLLSESCLTQVSTSSCVLSWARVMLKESKRPLFAGMCSKRQMESRVEAVGVCTFIASSGYSIT